MARSMACAGTRPDDIAHNAYNYGMFTGGLGFHYGAERLGCAVIPMSGGNTARQLQLMHDFGATVLMATPSYALKLAEAAEEAGIDIKSKLRIGLFGAEPWSNAMRAEVEARLGISTGDFWGLSEMTGPGVSCNCVGGEGLHLWEDCFLVEIVDPDTMEPLPNGEIGEIVITTLAKEAQPILRYRTRDLSSISEEPCDCGRTHARIQRIIGRSDDMLIIRGVNVFPSQIETVLLAVPGVEPHYELVVQQEGPMIGLTVKAEAGPLVGAGDYAGIAERIREKIKSEVGVSATVDVTAPGVLPRWEQGKAVRVRDLRQPA
jgi:phenylacetate-CoA ligase